MQVLVVKLGGVGDLVMALPIIKSLRSKDSRCAIDWLTATEHKEILESTRSIRHIFTLDKNKLLFGRFFSKCLQVLRAYWLIAFRSYDKVIIAHSDWRYRLLTLLTMKNKQIIVKMVPGRYHGDEYARATLEQEGHRVRLLSFPSCEAPISSRVLQFFKEHSHQYVVLAPGGNPKVEPGKELRMWPVEYYVQLAQMLIDEGLNVLVVGSKHDEWVLKYFSHLNVINGIDRFSAVELVPIFSQTAAVVTHDSGPMHLAVWADANLVALFGPTNPYEKLPLRIKEYQEHIRLVWGGEHLACRPCYNGKQYAKCANAICMKNIHPYQVYSKIQQLHHEKYSLSS